MRTSREDPLLPIVRAYAFPQGYQRERAIKGALATEKVRQEIREWLKSHKGWLAEDSNLIDLKRRLKKSKYYVQPSYCIKLYRYISGIFTFSKPPISSAYLFEAIESKNWERAKEIVRNDPHVLIEKADTIHHCLENNILPLPQLVFLLATASERLISPLLPTFPETQARDPHQNPSLFRIYWMPFRHFEMPVYLDSEILENALKIILEQDNVSYNPYFSEFDVTQVSSIRMYRTFVDLFSNIRLYDHVTTVRKDNTTWPKDNLDLIVVLPILLRKLSTRELQEILFSTKKREEEILQRFDLYVSDELTKFDWFRLCILVKNVKKPSIFTANMPEFALKYLAILLKDIPDIADIFVEIDRIEELSPSEKNAALACYIELRSIPLLELEHEFAETEILRLAPYLRLLNLEDFTDASFARELIGCCPNLNTIFIFDRTILDGVEELPECVSFYSYINEASSYYGHENSGNLRTLPRLPRGKYINVAQNSRLTELPPLPECRALSMNSCIRLLKLPPLPNCFYLEMRDIRNIPPMPSHPSHIVVITEDPPPLLVNINELSTQPKLVLLSLGQLILNYRPFPEIEYFSEIEASPAADQGGVQRDLVTKLCRHIFKRDLTIYNPLNFLRRDASGKPMIVADDPSDYAAYLTLGVILALCYLNTNGMKTGPIFDETVYRMICTEADPDTELWYLLNYLKTKFQNDEVIAWLSGASAAEVNLNDSDMEQLYYLNSDYELPQDNFTREYVLENLGTIRQNCIENAKEDLTLRAVGYLACGIKRRLPHNTWQQLLIDGPFLLRYKIEGIVTVNTLKEKLKFSRKKRVSDEEFEATKGYVLHWIDHATRRNLSRFVEAITGSPTLSDKDIAIKIFPRSPDNIASSHTCYETLELSSRYPNQEQFDARMTMFLEWALADNGFSAV